MHLLRSVMCLQLLPALADLYSLELASPHLADSRPFKFARPLRPLTLPMSKRPFDGAGGDDAKQEASKKLKREDADGDKSICSICRNEWEAASCVPHSLACGHSVCTNCLGGILKKTSKRSVRARPSHVSSVDSKQSEGAELIAVSCCWFVVLVCCCSASWKVRCPECRRETVVKIEGVKTSASLSALEAVKRMPRNYALVQACATRAQRVSAAVRCVIPGCANPVTHFCVTKCKDQCVKHERDCHAAASGFADHVRVPIADKAAHIAAQEQKDLEEVLAVAAKAAAAEATRELLMPHTAKIREVKANVQAADAELAKQRAGQQKQQTSTQSSSDLTARVNG